MLLNVQTAYSLLQSTLRLDQYVQQAKQYGYQHIGIADINSLIGVIEFYQAAKAQDLTPMIGMTMKTHGLIREDREYKVLLYAKNYKGYQELIALSKKLSQENLGLHEPWSFLKEHTENLVLISTGSESELEEFLLAGDYGAAEKVVRLWREIIGYENVYFGIAAYPYNPKDVALYIKFAQSHHLTMVANQKVNTLEAKDLFSLKVLEAIDQAETIELSLREMKGHHFLYPLDELRTMYQLAKIPDVMENTQQLINQLQFDIPLEQAFLPKFKVPAGYDADAYLKTLVEDSMKEKGLFEKRAYIDRAQYELSIISQMGFSDYFLIVWEIMDFCQKNNIRVGPGRGSAAGALISYLLGITFVDPLQYDLLFERFLNPERYNMPDIDLDIPDNKRDLVLKHIEEHYGHSQVAQIGTLGTFGAKQAVRDTLRVLGASTQEMSQWSRSIPTELNITLERAYTISAKLREIVQMNDQNRAIFQVALTLEGLPRHMSTHAAGVIIHDEPLEQIIPVMERSNQMMLSQLTMHHVEKVGLLKMDILGLRNLSLLDDILLNIKRTHGQTLDVYQFPMNDEATLALFKTADTNGVFQFESEGIKNVLRNLQPSEFEDIVAVNALFRPGPMQQIDEYIKRKKQQVPVEYLHPLLEPILKSTYGIIIYQEQVMQICQQLAGFTLGQADILRRAMGKKQADVMQREQAHFIEGAQERGIESDLAQKIYHYIEAFASYGFNRSHAVVYSTLAYQLAYLKAHYPLEFYQAILNQGRSNLNSFVDYIEEAKRRLGKILPVDINRSFRGVTIEEDALRIGFESIKGLRREMITHILDERKLEGNYQDLFSFLGRLPKKWQKQELIENLVRAGAFDSFGYNRATIFYNLPSFLQSIEYSGLNLNLFEAIEPKVDIQEEWSQTKTATEEKEALGFTLAPHPLEQYQAQLAALDDLNMLYQMKIKRKLKTIIFVQDIRVIETKKGDEMAFVTADTGKNEVSLVVFPNVYIRRSRMIQPHAILYMEGTVDRSRRGEMQVIVNHLAPVDEYISVDEKPKSMSKCFIRLTDNIDLKEVVEFVKKLATENPGPCNIIFVTEDKQTWQLDDTYQIGFGQSVQMELENRLGKQNIAFR